MVISGLSLARHASPEYVAVARKFSSIAENSTRRPGRSQKFTIELKENSDLQLRYRFLLACETNLQAYWSFRLLSHFGRGSIPSNLCDLIPLHSRENQELESAALNIKVNFNSLKRFPDSTAALTSSYSFCSIPHAEFCLKAA
jgi:hypothetical protein